MQTEYQLTFDRYRLDLTREQLWCGSTEIPLPGKAFALLCYLVAHAGQLVSKAELFAALWPGTAVTDGALTFSLVELRNALGDKATAPRFIETVHRRGYRFIEKVVSSQYSVVSREDNEPGARNTEHGTKIALGSPAPSTQHPASVLVGRESELTQLHHWFAKASHGERQIVFVTGEPGIGKTTLLEVFLKGLRNWELGLGSFPPQFPEPESQLPNPVAWVAVGQCIEHYGPGEPYMPILEALGRLCRAPGGEQLVTLLQQHAPTWLMQMPALLNATELEALQRKTTGATRERMLRELGEALDAITAERPLVLWLEDLHWSDVSTIELVALLARRRESARLLVIGTYRPVDVIIQEHPLRAVKQELQLHGLCAELSLGLLSEAQVAEYLAQRFAVGTHGRAPLRPFAKAIHRRTDGNPLFMVTAVNDLISQGVLVSGDAQRTLPDELMSVAIRVPDSVQQLITQQIERLSIEDRHLLEVASVAGMEFSAAAVAAGIELAPERVEELCEELARQAHFLRASAPCDWPDGTVAARYSFLHALYREVLYQRIPAGRRQRLHQRIGERQEAAYGKRTGEIATELAVHFEQGRDYGKAVQYLQQAGENAVQRSANVEAIRHLTTALALLETLPDTRERMCQELRLRIALGTPLQANRGFSSLEVRDTYTRALKLCQQVGETCQLFSVLYGLRTFHQVRGEFRTARELGEQLLGLAQREQDPIWLMEAHRALGSTLFPLGEFDAAQTHVERGIALYDTQRHYFHVFLHAGLEPGVFSFIYAAFVLWTLGYPDQARQKSVAACTLAQELSYPYSLANAQVYAAMLYQFRRDSALTHKWAEAASTLARQQGLPVCLGEGTILQGWAWAEQGQSRKGISQIRQGLATHRAVEAGLFRSYYLALLAEAYGKARQAEEGLVILTEALTVLDKSGERFYEAELYRLKGELTLQKGARDWGLGTGSPLSPALSLKIQIPREVAQEAEGYFLNAIEIARSQSAKSWELRATMSLVRFRQQQAREQGAKSRKQRGRDTQHAARTTLAEAHKMLSGVYHWFTEGFDTKDLQEAKALLES